jgi:hypothetical protein
MGIHTRSVASGLASSAPMTARRARSRASSTADGTAGRAPSDVSSTNASPPGSRPPYRKLGPAPSSQSPRQSISTMTSVGRSMDRASTVHPTAVWKAGCGAAARATRAGRWPDASTTIRARISPPSRSVTVVRSDEWVARAASPFIHRTPPSSQRDASTCARRSLSSIA